MAKDQSDDAQDKLADLFTDEESAILQQEAELLNGVKMSHANARPEFRLLCKLYETERPLFDALVALVKQESHTVSPEVLKSLDYHCCLTKEGAVRANLAAVLDAAYQETGPDAIPLRYPIRHASREQVEQINRIYDLLPGTEIPRRLLRHLKNHDSKEGNTPSR